MQVQICRKCGNRNTVVSGPLKSCNYCGSTDLEPVTDLGNPSGAVAVEEDGKGALLKWGLVFLGVGVAGGAAYWATTQFGGAPSNQTTHSIPIAQNQPATQIATLDQDVVKHDQDVVKHDQGKATQPQEEEIQITPKDSSIDSSADSSGSSSEISQESSPKASLEPEFENPVQLATTTTAASSEKKDKTLAQPIVVDPPAKDMEVNESTKSKAEDVKNTAVSQSLEPVKKAPEIEEIPVKASVKVAEAVPAPKEAQSKPKENVIKKPRVESSKTIAKVTTKTESVRSVKKEARQEEVQAVEEPPLTPQQIAANRLKQRSPDKIRGVVIDRQTGLMWMTCSVGQNWTGKGCSGEAEEFLWSEALDVAKDTRYANYGDWRLPTRDELHSIVHCPNGRLDYQLTSKGDMKVIDGVQQNGKCLNRFSNPTIDKAVFPNTSGGLYWSYSHDAHNNYSAWGVFFNKGYHYNYNTGNLGLVRLVRSM